MRDRRFPRPFAFFETYELLRWTEFRNLPEGGGWNDQDPSFVADFKLVHPIASLALAERAKKESRD